MSDLVKIIVTGDYCPHLRVEELALEGKHEQIYNEYYTVLTDKDLSIVNLECPLTDAEEGIEKIGPHLKADPYVIEALKYINVDMVSLANNHIMDFNLTGLIDTKNACERAGIKTVGAGFTIDQASKPALIKTKNRTIGIINYTENEFSIATKNKGGANPYNIIKIYEGIENLQDKCDIILLIIHGGNEFYSLPNPRFVKELRFFGTLGVSAIICHHTHCYSGYEVYNEVPIFYGLGNFIFDWEDMNDDNFRIGYFVKLQFDKYNKCSFTIHPYKQFKERPGLRSLSNIERKKFDQNIKALSRIITNDKLLNDKWEKFCKEKSRYYLESIKGYGRIRKALSRLGLNSGKQREHKHYLRLLDYIDCESHRDILTNILRKETGA